MDLINVPNVQEDVSVDDGDLINDSQQPEVVSDGEEIIEQSENNGELEQQPLIIETKGKWQPFEAMANTQFVEGQTYNIKVQGKCEFMISKDRPTFGIQTNEFPYTKTDDDNRLWIKTGG
jgi:hypothetical protein